MAVDLYTPVNSYWGYRAIPETGTNIWETPVFSPAETYKLRADWYYNLGDKNLWDAYSALWRDSNAYSNTASQINDFYWALANDIIARESGLAWVKSELADKLINDMANNRQYVMDMFWPNWTLTNEINKYYDDLWNYLATDAGRQAATIAAQWMHSWASLWAIRAQQNQAYNESFGRYIQAKEQEINAKQQIAANLINYMSTLRKEYWDTTNQYIISQYQRANDLLESVSKSIADNNAQLASLRLTNSTKGSSSSEDAMVELLERALGWGTTPEGDNGNSNGNNMETSPANKDNKKKSKQTWSSTTNIPRKMYWYMLSPGATLLTDGISGLANKFKS